MKTFEEYFAEWQAGQKARFASRKAIGRLSAHSRPVKAVLRGNFATLLGVELPCDLEHGWVQEINQALDVWLRARNLIGPSPFPNKAARQEMAFRPED
jgi:hypothetical protein